MGASLFDASGFPPTAASISPSNLVLCVEVLAIFANFIVLLRRRLIRRKFVRAWPRLKENVESRRTFELT